VEAPAGSLLGGRKDTRPVRTEWWGAGVVVCLDQGADDSYDLHINYMTYTLFLFQIIGFKKYFYVSLGNNFLLFFVEAPGQLSRFAPPLKSGPEQIHNKSKRRNRSNTFSVVHSLRSMQRRSYA